MKGHLFLIIILVARDQWVDFEPSCYRTVVLPSAWSLIMIHRTAKLFEQAPKAQCGPEFFFVFLISKGLSAVGCTTVFIVL